MLIGNLTRDPERTTASGIAYVISRWLLRAVSNQQESGKRISCRRCLAHKLKTA